MGRALVGMHRKVIIGVIWDDFKGGLIRWASRCALLYGLCIYMGCKTHHAGLGQVVLCYPFTICIDYCSFIRDAGIEIA